MSQENLLQKKSSLITQPGGKRRAWRPKNRAAFTASPSRGAASRQAPADKIPLGQHLKSRLQPVTCLHTAFKDSSMTAAFLARPA
jgi:hypothetical protein